MAGNNDLQQTLRRGIAAARSGDRTTGRRLLEQVTQADPDNELAWFWLALCVNTVGERRDCLERVLQINPNNDRARQALNQLGGGSARTTASAGGSPQDVRRLRQLGQASTGAGTSQPRRGTNSILLVIGVLLIVILVGAGVLLSEGLLGDDPEPTATLQAVIVSTDTPLPPTNTAGPTPTPMLFFGNDSNAPTLPPTFTPTPEPTATETSEPTTTPFPLADMDALLVNQTLGQVDSELYNINGDGSGEQLVGAGFQDITYDLGGERIAFVRDVAYENENGTFTYPELFVAPVDNPSEATQVTDFQTSIIASPSFSPEGEELVFVANVDGSEDIWYIAANGEGRRRLTENDDLVDRDPAWRPIPGSREIVFASDRDSVGNLEIYSFDIFEPGDEPEFTRLTNASGSSHSPAWSHRGDLIVFISDRRSDPDVYLMDANGVGDTLLTRDDAGAEDREPSFAPDGRFVSFISNRLDDRFQTYVVSLNGDVLTRVTENEGDDLQFIYKPELILRVR